MIRSQTISHGMSFAHALPMYLKKDLERVEKRALAIICPGLSYTDALELSNVVSINDYNASSIVNDPTHRLHSMLQFREPSRYDLRH